VQGQSLQPLHRFLFWLNSKLGLQKVLLIDSNFLSQGGGVSIYGLSTTFLGGSLLSVVGIPWVGAGPLVLWGAEFLIIFVIRLPLCFRLLYAVLGVLVGHP